MRLAQLIHDQTEDIATEWAAWAQREVASDGRLPVLEVRDHFPELLRELVAALDRAKEDGDGYAAEAAHHAQHRLIHRFQLREVVYEYRILRRVIFRRVLEGPTELGILRELARMNEALDVATAEAVDRFATLRLKEQQARVEQASAFRERFIGIVSHDLRNPVNAIAMSTALILKAEGLPPAIGKLAGRILANTERMVRMIGDLLDLTRGRLGGGIPIVPKRTHLPSVARAVVESMTTTHPDRRIVVHESGDDLDGEWDEDRLVQLIGNLVGNALDHGDPTSPVELTLSCAREHVTIAVHNRGPRIPAAEIPHLFEAFRAGDARSSKGLGLGLYIAREIVHAHGGRIAVASDDAEGTTFSVNLPRRAKPTVKKMGAERTPA